MEDQDLINTINQALSLTSDEKIEIINNLPIFSSEDKQFFKNIFLYEQENIQKALSNHFIQEEKIIIKYLKIVLKLYDTEQLIHIKNKIHDLIIKEHREDDVLAAENLLLLI